jgi:hypothetical protein
MRLRLASPKRRSACRRRSVRVAIVRGRRSTAWRSIDADELGERHLGLGSGLTPQAAIPGLILESA